MSLGYTNHRARVMFVRNAMTWGTDSYHSDTFYVECGAVFNGSVTLGKRVSVTDSDGAVSAGLTRKISSFEDRMLTFVNGILVNYGSVL